MLMIPRCMRLLMYTAVITSITATTPLLTYGDAAPPPNLSLTTCASAHCIFLPDVASHPALLLLGTHLFTSVCRTCDFATAAVAVDIENTTSTTLTDVVIEVDVRLRDSVETVTATVPGGQVSPFSRTSAGATLENPLRVGLAESTVLDVRIRSFTSRPATRP